MLRSQRLLVICGLVFIAWLLNVTYCDWGINRSATFTSNSGKQHTLICGWETERTPMPPTPIAPTLPTPGATAPPTPRFLGVTTYEVRYTGIVSQRGMGHRDAVLIGIIAPLALLLAAGYLWLGGRHADRVARGLCPKCKYPVGASDVCTECGTRVKPGK